MAQEQSPASGVSRRDFLHVAALGGGAVMAASLVPSPAAAAKMSPRAMQYRPTPNGNQRCDNCVNFQAPGACKLVDGPISPSGWCILYNPKR
jgi:anaerobic selenocysteine-containing dehydrogenase